MFMIEDGYFIFLLLPPLISVKQIFTHTSTYFLFWFMTWEMNFLTNSNLKVTNQSLQFAMNTKTNSLEFFLTYAAEGELFNIMRQNPSKSNIHSINILKSAPALFYPIPSSK